MMDQKTRFAFQVLAAELRLEAARERARGVLVEGAADKSECRILEEAYLKMATMVEAAWKAADKL